MKDFEGTDTLRIPPRNIKGTLPKNQKIGVDSCLFANLGLFVRAQYPQNGKQNMQNAFFLIFLAKRFGQFKKM